MRLTTIALAGLMATAIGAAGQATTKNNLIVHEWGTFLTMDGSDGVTLDGMYHEEHALPDFVHSRSKEQLFRHLALMKGETPVIYFYTDRPQRVSVNVGFPRGIWTQWYPQVERPDPIGRDGSKALADGSSSITWQAWLIPAQNLLKPPPGLSKTSADALWNYARNVDAAYVRTQNSEVERFLFYRGLGTASLPLGFSSEAGGTLSLSASEPITLNHLYVLRVEHGKGVYRYIPSLGPGSHLDEVIPDMTAAKPLQTFTREISDDLAGKLTASGLYAKEARAMVNTWSNSYFKTDGVRVIYILPREWTDKFIPLDINPRPGAVVRVMVGRIELLMPDRESRVVHAVRDLIADDAEVQNRAFAVLRGQGRYLEPILRYELTTSTDATVRRVSERLLRTDFVNNIRPPVYQADTGARIGLQSEIDRKELAALIAAIR